MASSQEVELSEYATALRTIVLENADEIFAECKKRDPNSCGTLPTDTFSEVIALILGLPPSDVSLLFSGASLNSHIVAYASWLLKLQGEKSPSLNRERLSARLNSSFDSLVLSEDDDGVLNKKTKDTTEN